MSSTLIISLIIFGILLILVSLYTVIRGLIPIKYSIVWIFAGAVILFTGVFPDLFVFISDLVGVMTLSNMIIAILISLLLLISLSLTIIVSKQKRLIKMLIQEVSIIKNKN